MPPLPIKNRIPYKIRKVNGVNENEDIAEELETAVLVAER